MTDQSLVPQIPYIPSRPPDEDLVRQGRDFYERMNARRSVRSDRKSVV